MSFDPSRERALYQLHRKSDPVTSRMAAATVLPKLTKIQSEILAWARGRTFTDLDLVAAFPNLGPSTLRTRRSELRDAGLILDTGLFEVHSGRRHTVWQART